MGRHGGGTTTTGASTATGGATIVEACGGGNGWHEANEAGRKAIWEAHKQYTLEFIHFLKNDPAIPQQMRDRYKQWGFCKDEFVEYGHFSPALYVRESRRRKRTQLRSPRSRLTHMIASGLR